MNNTVEIMNEKKNRFNEDTPQLLNVSFNKIKFMQHSRRKK